jgi:glycosyltransferase involved in cell wall biosynthesis
MSLVIMVRTRLTTGGIAEPVVADTAKSLSKLGHRIILLAWDRTGKFETMTTTEWGTIWRYQEKCPLNNPFVFARKLPGFLWWSTWQILAFHKLEKKIILHYHDLDTLPGGVFTSKILERPLVYDCHENYPGLVKGAVSNTIAKGLHKFEAILLKNCTAIISAGPANYARIKNMLESGTKAPFAATEEEANAVMSLTNRDFLNSKITRIGNVKRLETYPLRKIENREKRANFRILYIGVLEKHPSRGIIETALTVNTMKGVQLDIGGFGTLVPILKKMEKKMNNVKYMGAIHPDNVPLQTIECDAVLMALDPSNINNRLSAPNKLFEAMAAGVPIITCKELLMGKFVEREGIGLTFEWGRWDRLKAVIMKMMFDQQKCAEMGKRARKLAERTHNWENCEERLESLYKFVKKTNLEGG